MPTGKSVLDTYDQFAVLACQGTATTVGFLKHKLETGYTIMQKVGWLASRVEYYIPVSWLQALTVAGNNLRLGISQSADVTNGLGLEEPTALDIIRFGARMTVGTPADGAPLEQTIIRHDIVPGGMLIVPVNLYLGIEWASNGNFSTEYAYARLWYKEVDLTDADYYDLLQLRMPLGV